jgi:hypothetical protein
VTEGNAVARRLESLPPAERERLRRALAERKARRPQAVPRRAGPGPAPLSFSQEALWFLEQWDPGAPTNHGVRAFRLEGDLDAGALEGALSAIVARHEILRSVYSVHERRPVQAPLEDWALTLPVVDVADTEELPLLLREESRRPFDLERDLTVRPTLFRLGPSSHVLLLVLHHIAADGWSGTILTRELSLEYAAGGAGTVAEPPLQYADFAVWQRDRLSGATLDGLLQYWTGVLEGAPVQLRLPTDRARPPVQMHRGRHVPVSYDRAVGDALAEIARREGATLYMALLACFATLLYRFSSQDDILVGTPVANRNHVELEPLIGLFSNTLVIRNRLSGNPTFAEVLRRVREAAVGAYEHQELPFEKLVESLRVPRDPAFNPLFQVNFRAAGTPPEPLSLDGLRVEPVKVDIGFSRFDLALDLQLEADGLRGYFEYDEDLFDASTVGSLADDLGSLLEAVSTDPERPILALVPGRGPKTQTPIRRSRRLTTDER